MDDKEQLSDELKTFKSFRTELLWESRIQTAILIISLFGITTVGILMLKKNKK